MTVKKGEPRTGEFGTGNLLGSILPIKIIQIVDGEHGPSEHENSSKAKSRLRQKTRIIYTIESRAQ